MTNTSISNGKWKLTYGIRVYSYSFRRGYYRILVRTLLYLECSIKCMFKHKLLYGDIKYNYKTNLTSEN